MHPMESRAEDGRANFHDSRGQKNAERDVANVREKERVRDAGRLRHASSHRSGRSSVDVSAGPD